MADEDDHGLLTTSSDIMMALAVAEMQDVHDQLQQQQPPLPPGDPAVGDDALLTELPLSHTMPLLSPTDTACLQATSEASIASLAALSDPVADATAALVRPAGVSPLLATRSLAFPVQTALSVGSSSAPPMHRLSSAGEIDHLSGLSNAPREPAYSDSHSDSGGSHSPSFNSKRSITAAASMPGMMFDALGAGGSRDSPKRRQTFSPRGGSPLSGGGGSGHSTPSLTSVELRLASNQFAGVASGPSSPCGLSDVLGRSMVGGVTDEAGTGGVGSSSSGVAGRPFASGSQSFTFGRPSSPAAVVPPAAHSFTRGAAHDSGYRRRAGASSSKSSVLAEPWAIRANTPTPQGTDSGEVLAFRPATPACHARDPQLRLTHSDVHAHPWPTLSAHLVESSARPAAGKRQWQPEHGFSPGSLSPLGVWVFQFHPAVSGRLTVT